MYMRAHIHTMMHTHTKHNTHTHIQGDCRETADFVDMGVFIVYLHQFDPLQSDFSVTSRNIKPMNKVTYKYHGIDEDYLTLCLIGHVVCVLCVCLDGWIGECLARMCACVRVVYAQ